MASFDNDQINVDLSALPPNVPSLCIPRVFKNITRERVMACFKDLGIGFVERIDMIPRKSDNGDEFQRVFIHLRWNKSELASKARTRVLAGKEIKIIYDEPWFWKVSANRSVSRDSTRDSRDSRDSRAPRATLALEEDDLESSIRKMKASDRDRKDGYRPRNHTHQTAGGYKPQQQKQHSRPQQKQELRPRSPSCSPPPPIASAESFIGGSATASATASARSPSPEVADECVSCLDVDTPISEMPTINYGDCGKLPVPKKRRVIKPKMVIRLADTFDELGEVRGEEQGEEQGEERGEEVGL
jgi:hypothetical protein